MWKVYIAYATKKAATRVSNSDMTCVPTKVLKKSVPYHIYYLKSLYGVLPVYFFLPAPAADSLSPKTVNAEEMLPIVTDMLT